jgi:hypothetical protein
LWVLEYFVLDVSTIDDLPAKERIRSLGCLVTLVWGTSQRNAAIILGVGEVLPSYGIRCQLFLEGGIEELRTF